MSVFSQVKFFSLLPKWPPDEVSEKIGLANLRCLIIALGVNGKNFLRASQAFEALLLDPYIGGNSLQLAPVVRSTVMTDRRMICKEQFHSHPTHFINLRALRPNNKVFFNRSLA